ncbi:MAG: OmpA family protein [Tenacibaculum sp.]
MNKKILILFFLISAMSFGQRKSIADRYFKEYAYKKAVELYKSIYNKGDDSYLVISRLGDSYYYNSKFLKAEEWYEKLYDVYSDVIEPEHVFKYSQTLKSNGKVKESDDLLIKLNAIVGNDSRLRKLESNRNYFTEYTNKKKIFVNVNNLSVNTKYSDFGGFIFGEEFYYASTKPIDLNGNKIYKWNNQPHLNIYKAKQFFNIEKKYLEVKEEEVVKDIGSLYHDSNPVITSDGTTIYFTRTSSEKNKLKGGENKEANLKIYRGVKKEGKWTDIHPLPFNNDDYSIGHPALSTDEKTLFFVSNMPNGYGATDIYRVDILEGNNFSEPQNLGSDINTEGREMFPFIDEDNTLYFSSDGHLGLGALDVFKSKKKSNKFTKPTNLGVPINSPYDDFSFLINNKKNNGFFSSNRKGGEGDDDIYSFIVYSCKEDITGVISEKDTDKPIFNAIVKLIDKKGKVISEVKTNEGGSYSFEMIDCEKEFTVVASKEDYKNLKKVIKTASVDKVDMTADLQLESLIVKNEIIINPIYFAFDKFNVEDAAAYELEHIVSVMQNHPTMVIKIESHTDSRGEQSYNKLLSDKRAKSTKDYILSRGIAESRIESAIGYGEEQLLNDCDDKNQTKCSKEEHQKNRRSYFYIVKR